MKFNVKKTTDTDNTQNEEFYTDADMAANADDDAAMSDIDFGFEDQVSDDDAQNDAIMFGHELDDDTDDDTETEEADEAEPETDADDESADEDDPAPADPKPAPVKITKPKTAKTKTEKTKSKTAKAKSDVPYTVASYSTADDDIDIATYPSQEEAVKAVIKDFTKVLSSPEVFMNLDGDVVFNTEKTVIKTTDGKKIWKIKA